MSLWNDFLDNIAKPVGRTFGNSVDYWKDAFTGNLGSPSQFISNVATDAGVEIGAGPMLRQLGVEEEAQKVIKENLKYSVKSQTANSDLVLRAGVKLHDEVISPYITRPISTLGLLTDLDSPLYVREEFEKGFQIKDIRAAYERSEKVSMGQAFTKSDLTTIKYAADFVFNAGGIDLDNVDLWNDNDIQRAFVDNTVGSYFTGVLDFTASNIAISGAFGTMAKAGNLAARGVGLSTRGKAVSQFEMDINDGVTFKNSDGASGRLTTAGSDIQRMTNTTDINEVGILVKKYSNNANLIGPISRATDVNTVRDLILADKGYFPALDRLSKGAPADLFEIADMNSVLKARVIEEGKLPDFDQVGWERMNAAFDDAINRVPEYRFIRDALLNPETKTPWMQGKNYMPAEPVLGKAPFIAARERVGKIQAAAVTRDFSKLGGIEERILGGGLNGPITRVIRFTGTELPLGFFSFSGSRPFDVFKEVDAFFDDFDLFKNGSNMVSITPTTKITAAEYRNSVKQKLANAETNIARKEVLEELDNQLPLITAFSNGFYDVAKIKAFAQEIKSKVMDSTATIARQGYGMDATGARILTDAQTQSQLIESYRMGPWNFVEKELTLALKKPGAELAAIRTTDTVKAFYETFNKYWTIDVLGRPSYIWKNSLLEPSLSATMAHGVKVVTDGVPTMTKNFLFNNKQRVMGQVAKVYKGKEYKAVNQAVEDLSTQLDAVTAQLDVLTAEASLFLEPTLHPIKIGPKALKENKAVVLDQLKKTQKLVDDIELELRDAISPFGTMSQVPTIAGLERRIAYLKNIGVEEVAKMVPARIIKNTDEMISILNSQRNRGFTVENYKEFEDSLIKYTNGSGDYSLVNSVLRGGYKASEKEALKVNKIVSDMDSLISAAPVLDESIITFRGLSLDKYSQEYLTNLRSLKPGDTFTEKGFSSTSLGEEVATGIARGTGYYSKSEFPVRGLVLEITNPVGTKGIFPIGMRAQVTEKLAKGESEWLLPRNTKFQVTEITDGKIKVTVTGIPKTGTATPASMVKRGEATSKANKTVTKVFQAQASKVAEAELAVLQAKRALQSIAPDGAELLAANKNIAMQYKAIDDILQSLGEARVKQADTFGKDAKYKARYYGKPEQYRMIAGQWIPIKSLFDENLMGAAFKSEFGNSRTVAATYLGERTIGVRQGMVLRRGPSTTTYINDPNYFEELAYYVNRSLRNDPLIKQALEGLPEEKIIQWAQSDAGTSYLSQFGVVTEGNIPNLVRDRIGLVNRYLPDAEARSLALTKDVTSIELQKILSPKSRDLSPIHPLDFNVHTASEFGARTLGQIEQTINKGASWIFNKLTAPENPIRWASADRFFADSLAQKVNTLSAQGFKFTKADGTVDFDKINSIRSAARREALDMNEKTFYTIRRQNRGLYAARLATAFPTASLNAFYRYGRFALKNPERVSQFLYNYQAAFRSFGVDEYGIPTDDPLKATHIVVPTTNDMGFFGGKGVRLNARSIGFLLNYPTPSLYASIATAKVFQWKPDSEDLMKQYLGSYYDVIFPYGPQTSIGMAVAPRWASDLWNYANGPESKKDFLDSYKDVHNYYRTLDEMKILKYPGDAAIRKATQENFLVKFGWSFNSLFGVPAKADTRPMKLYEDAYGLLVNKYQSQGIDITQAKELAGSEFLSKVGTDFPLDRITFKGSSSNAYIQPTSKAYNRVFVENEKLASELANVDPALVGLLTADLDQNPKEFNLSVYRKLQDPDTKLPGGKLLNDMQITPKEEERRRGINRVWDLYNQVTDILEQKAQDADKKSLRSHPELLAARKEIASTLFRKESEDWWTEYNDPARGDKSFNYAYALNKVAFDESFMKKYGKTKFWSDVSDYLAIRNSIVDIYQDYPANDPRKSKLKKSYNATLDTFIPTWHPRLQDIIKRYFEEDTMKDATQRGSK
jgi:hypothetical protein